VITLKGQRLEGKRIKGGRIVWSKSEQAFYMPESGKTNQTEWKKGGDAGGGKTCFYL